MLSYVSGNIVSAVEGLYSIFFPAECIMCKSYHEAEFRWLCPACSDDLIGMQVPGVVGAKLQNDVVMDVFCRWPFDEKLQGIIHAMKYRNHPSVGHRLGVLADGVSIFCQSNEIILVPVPLHAARLLQRGFNQSKQICKGLASRIPHLEICDCLARKKKTSPQAQLENRKERAENVRDAFVLLEKYKKYLAGRHLVLVDDVYTTGSTMRECAYALSSSGAQKVSAFTLCRA